VGVISKFEGMMETVVEGSFSRLFKSRIHPAEISKKLERLMEDSKEVALGKSFVPNRYEVYLNPSDFSQFSPHRAAIERDMSDHILSYSRQRNFVFSSGKPQVWLNSSDQLRPRKFSIRAYTVDVNQVQMPAASKMAAAEIPESEYVPGATAILNVGAISLTDFQKSSSGSTAISRPDASLTVLHYAPDQPGKYIKFSKDVNIGRGLSNQIVFSDDPRISRQHARIEFKYGQFLLTDLNSANGTKVNGQPVTQIVLSPGDKISLGGFELLFQVN